ncbi:FAS1-like dehydratase domain-containing protein [Rhizohabitans arisaemae]|uniref:FAS1-like dehydratase domain-containing protein n=1 Tax=Rhizohabitans arisaemae TaxID=2720610 RepID=UPI0024B26C0C|nr:MaoC family dehydratase N-terminal domain-containing protein [Rhizohabitans arisaemae]
MTTVERTELILPGPAVALGNLLGVDLPNLAEGAPLPLCWHWLYLLDRPAQSDLGPDGHPVRNTVPQPIPGKRRMWAGGRIRTLGPLRCGETATRRTTVLKTEQKDGRTGPLTFVAVRHEVEQVGRIVIEERQDLVYRDPAGALGDPPPQTPVPPTAEEWNIEVTPTLLFRFSALTYNAHRIHYDLGYARDVEGYPGLVTHGPLQALVMAEAARGHGLTAAGTTYDYRLVAPLFEFQGLIVRADVHGRRAETAARDIGGRLTARGSIVVE